MLNSLMNINPEDELDYNALMQMMGVAQSPEPMSEPMLLAAGGNGLSFQTNQALGQLERDMNPPPPPPQRGVGTAGTDSRITQEWRDRNAEAQNKLLQELLARRRAMEQQLRGQR